MGIKFSLVDLETDPSSIKAESSIKKHALPKHAVPPGDGSGTFKKTAYRRVDVGDDLIAQTEE